MAAFGALFGLAGLAAGDEPGGVLMMVVFGVGSAVFGASLAIARVLAIRLAFGIGTSFRGASR